MTFKFVPTDYFVVRRPTLPYYPRHISGKKDILSVVQSDLFHEAIYYASPDLYDEVQKYIGKGLPIKETKRMLRTLCKYSQRIKYRATPFGAFAYCSIGRYSDSEMDMKLSCDTDNNENEITLHYRYDCQFLFDLVVKFLKECDDESLFNLNVCVNQSLMKKNGRCYFSRRNLETGLIVESVVESSGILDFILNVFEDGTPCSVIISKCKKNFDIDENLLIKYIRNLILGGILISDIEVATTECDNFQRIYSKIPVKSHRLIPLMIKTLEILNSERSFDLKHNAIENLFNKAKRFGISLKRNRLIQVDAYSEDLVILDGKIKKSIINWFEHIKYLSPSYNNPLNAFIYTYNERYEGAKMPLLTVLHPKFGIGYNSNLEPKEIITRLNGFQGKVFQSNLQYTYTLTAFERLLLDKILINIESGLSSHLTLTESELKTFKHSKARDYSLSYNCMYSVFGFDEDGPIIGNVSFSGSSASNLITRFHDGLEGINDLLKEIEKSESLKNDNIILAEISHLSHPRSGNVQLRPGFRDYEIPFIAYDDNKRTNRIDLDDLYISIENGKVKLFSYTLQKEVIPCFSSAFNYNNSSSELYRFLGDVQNQNVNRCFMVNLMSLLSLLGHTPRVRYQNIIISPEMWLIDCDSLTHNYSNQVEIFKNLHNQLKMPKYLSFSQGDNYLVVDVEEEESIEVFLKEVSTKTNKIILKEFLPLSPDFNHYESIIEVVQPLIPVKA